MTTPDTLRASTACVLLAGGQSRRMGGGDKTLLDLDGRPMLAHVLDRLRPQVGPLLLNANGDPERFRSFDVPIVPDAVPGYAGPLAGILTGLEWARHNHPAVTHVLSAPADAPFLPTDLLARLHAALKEGDADIACAMSGGRSHPVCALWPVALADALRHAVVEEEMRKIDRWTARYRVAHVEWPTRPVDPFYNVNRPEDMEEARRLLETARGAVPPDDPVPAPQHVLNVGVVLETQPSTHPWGEDTVVPVAVVPGLGAEAPWRDLGTVGDRQRWCSPGLPVELFPKETEGYRYNLSAPEPAVYVVLRPAEGRLSREPFHVTVCPYEAETYLDGGDSTVETVPMPPEVLSWVQAFVERHHHDRPFVKRKQKPKSTDKTADDPFARIPPVQRHRQTPGGRHDA